MVWPCTISGFGLNAWSRPYKVSYTISEKLRVTVAVVHTGSRLVRFACGTKISVLALPPIAGRASGEAAAKAALAMKARLFKGIILLDISRGDFLPDVGETQR